MRKFVVAIVQALLKRLVTLKIFCIRKAVQSKSPILSDFFWKMTGVFSRIRSWVIEMSMPLWGVEDSAPLWGF